MVDVLDLLLWVFLHLVPDLAEAAITRSGF